MRVPAATLAGVMGLLVASGAAVQERLDVFLASRDHPAIAYSRDSRSDRVAALDASLESGKATLAFEATGGYLRATLGALGIPPESQTLVFSETSAQAEHISPTNPRALYFSDDVAVGWVRGAEALEVAAFDARQGIVFYTLDQRASPSPRFARQNSCLLCHQTWETLGVPGLQVLSTFPMSDDPRAYASGVVMDHRTPFAQRWGGWYVTAERGSPPHLGNRPVIVPAHELQAGRRPTLNMQSVRGRFDLDGYLTPCSDIVALCVLTHQAHAANLLIRLGWEARVAAADAPLPTAAGSAGHVAASPRVAAAVDALADYLAFADEALFPAGVEGGCGYAQAFSRRGPRDSRGRSLRDFDLRTRLFRYPVSYMIYAPAFDALPAEVRTLVYRQIWSRLSTAPPTNEPGAPDVAARRAAIEIVRETKADVPEWFR
jgi:hypothetical protein